MQVNSKSVFFFENCAGSLDFYAINSNEIDAIVKNVVPILWPLCITLLLSSSCYSLESLRIKQFAIAFQSMQIDANKINT